MRVGVGRWFIKHMAHCRYPVSSLYGHVNLSSSVVPSSLSFSSYGENVMMLPNHTCARPFSTLHSPHYDSSLRCSFRCTYSYLTVTEMGFILRSQRRRSHISSFKEDGYYRLAQLRDIHIHDDCYSVISVRGGGPGGQGSNSSSNKVELRVNLAVLSEYFDEQLIDRLKENERGKSLTTDEKLIIISSHEHRSAYQNKEDTLQRLKVMIQRASWVPPVEVGPIKRPATIITTQKLERRKKGSVRKMQRTARKGLW